MRKINFEEYNKKRKKAQVDILKLRDQLKKDQSSAKRTRLQDKQFLLYKLAKKRKEKMIEKVGKHRYRFK